MSEVLCRACGLCCDGSLFGRVPLAPDDRKRLPLFGSAIDQPCTAHVDGACSVYDERPSACRTFVCRLLARGGPLEAQIARVRHVRRLLESAPGNADELRRRIEEDFTRATADALAGLAAASDRT